MKKSKYTHRQEVNTHTSWYSVPYRNSILQFCELDFLGRTHLTTYIINMLMWTDSLASLGVVEMQVMA